MHRGTRRSFTAAVLTGQRLGLDRHATPAPPGARGPAGAMAGGITGIAAPLDEIHLPRAGAVGADVAGPIGGHRFRPLTVVGA